MTFYKKSIVALSAILLTLSSGKVAKSLEWTNLEYVPTKSEVKKMEEARKKTFETNIYLAVGANIVPKLKLEMAPQSSSNQNGVSKDTYYKNGKKPLFGVDVAFGGYIYFLDKKYIKLFISPEVQYSYMNYSKKFVDGDRTGEARIKHLVAFNIKPGIRIWKIDLFAKGSIGAGYFAHAYNNECDTDADAFMKRWKFIYGFGVGVGIHITRNIGIIAEYSRFFTVHEDLTEYKNASGKMTINQLAVKFQYTF